MVVSNTYSVVLFVLLVVVLCLVYGCVQHIQCCVIFLVCGRPVSCVWLCPAYIMLYYLSCQNHTQDSGRRQTRQIIQHYTCWTQPYTRHRTTTNKTNNTTLYVLDTSNTHSVVLFVLFVVVLCLVYGCVQHI
jgi:hypothetical protein